MADTKGSTKRGEAKTAVHYAPSHGALCGRKSKRQAVLGAITCEDCVAVIAARLEDIAVDMDDLNALLKNTATLEQAMADALDPQGEHHALTRSSSPQALAADPSATALLCDVLAAPLLSLRQQADFVEENGQPSMAGKLRETIDLAEVRFSEERSRAAHLLHACRKMDAATRALWGNDLALVPAQWRTELAGIRKAMALALPGVATLSASDLAAIKKECAEGRRDPLLEACRLAEAFIADDTCRHDSEKAAVLAVLRSAEVSR